MSDGAACDGCRKYQCTCDPKDYEGTPEVRLIRMGRRLAMSEENSHDLRLALLSLLEACDLLVADVERTDPAEANWARAGLAHAVTQARQAAQAGAVTGDLQHRLAALETENERLREAGQQARRHLAQAQRFLTRFWNSDPDAICHVRGQITKASEALSGRAARVLEGGEE